MLLRNSPVCDALVLAIADPLATVANFDLRETKTAHSRDCFLELKNGFSWRISESDEPRLLTITLQRFTPKVQDRSLTGSGPKPMFKQL